MEFRYLTLLLAVTLACAQDLCSEYKNCTACIRKPDCAWCKDNNYRESLYNQTTGQAPLFRGTRQALIDFGCNINEIVDPQNSEPTKPVTSTSRVSPNTFSINLRIGETIMSSLFFPSVSWLLLYFCIILNSLLVCYF